MNPYTSVAQKAVFRVGKTINQIFEKIDKLHPDQRADMSLFDELYRQIEEEMVKEILASFPEHSIETKHVGSKGSPNNRNQWYVSGICGEENFISHHPYFSISVAYAFDGKTMSGVVYNPFLDELYMASRNESALYNETRLRIPKHSGKLDDALLLTDYNAMSVEDYERQFNNMNKFARGVRILGDIALDICQVAKGDATGLWAKDFNECDTKAAILIALESGALVTDFKGSERYYENNQLVVTNTKLLKSFLQALND